MVVKRSRKLSLLLVEDEPDIIETLSDHLVLEGYETHSTAKFTDAMFKLKNQKYDCILLDIHLAQGSGEQVVETLREDKTEKNHKTPIIVMSGGLDKMLVQNL